MHEIKEILKKEDRPLTLGELQELARKIYEQSEKTTKRHVEMAHKRGIILRSFGQFPDRSNPTSYYLLPEWKPEFSLELEDKGGTKSIVWKQKIGSKVVTMATPCTWNLGETVIPVDDELKSAIKYVKRKE